MKKRHLICAVSELGPGERRVAVVKGREILVINQNGEYFGLLNKCPHEGARLSHGITTGLYTSPCPGKIDVSRDGQVLRCPWHGWEFDIRTGQSYCDPGHTFVKRYNIEVEPGAAVAKGPFVAESFDVVSDQEYLFVEL